MAKHATRKTGMAGKSGTLARKARRAVKYATAELDVERILSTLDSPLAVAR